ncbi:MAG TPA: hypothetical protein VFL70_04765, partial [Bacteroidia bacterium]|nr:hypothetical protein [Bacteroidia bacterium]
MPAANYFQNELKKYQAIHASEKITASANWTPIGPTSAIGLEEGIGRVQCFAMDPNNSNNYWAGTPGGGLWKSTNAGASWTTNTDDFVSLGISSILINPSNSNIMYISTGDPDGRHTVSTGVLKSTDGGNTWTQTGLNFTTTQGKDIDQLKFLPNNPNVILAATSDGIYRSSNAGTSWTLINNTAYTYDIAFHPTNANIVYAVCSSNFVKSTDGGVTWSVITSGLPTSLGDARVAITPAAPNNVYILIAQGDFFKSTNSGTSF